MPHIQALQIRVRGIVQGVGFRPWVWHLAQAHGIKGRVWNDAAGVLIHAWASRASLDGFVAALRAGPPPLARIEAIETSPLPNLPTGLPTDRQTTTAPCGFEIVTSRTGEVSTDIAPDAATCALCLEDILSPGNRRHGYAFTNCTHCGPRLSIIHALPYDRANTSMAGFALCPACLEEYQNPADRRFHAQPNACPACGPRLWLEDAQGQRLECKGAPLALAAALLKQGQILAIKGIGGFHLACDATNAAAIARLRQRKVRNHKPFALMARDLEMLRRYAWATQAEAELLASPAAPIVILRAKAEEPLPDSLADGLTPGQDSLGFMLPYSPLHQLLFALVDAPLVMTSGNRSDEPQCIDNEDARARLGPIADALLLHDRPIQNRLDDSLARLVLGQPQLLRRARGYTPEPLRLPAGFEQAPPLLAMGAELKNTFALIKAGRLVVSQHLGDLEDASTLRDYLHQLALYQRLYALRPEVIAIDAHPDYLSSQQGQRLGEQLDIPVVRVTHHHAHIAAVMLEHGLPLATGPVLGLALDGLGLGFDAQGNPELWGGEFLLADYLDYRRLGRLRPVALPGGAKAMQEPWRNTLAHLLDCFEQTQLAACRTWSVESENRPQRAQFLSDLQPNSPAIGQKYGEKCAAAVDLQPTTSKSDRLLEAWCTPTGLLPELADRPLAAIARMLERGINAPLASSAGRLFDALAAALGICTQQLGYEGQTGIELETLARPWMDSEQAHAYGVAVQEGHNQLLELSWRPLWQGLLADKAAQVETGRMAARFHWALIIALGDVALRLCQTQGLSKVVLSGGVMQNLLLLEGLANNLTEAGLEVLIPRRYPANDGGLSLGQAAIAAARWIQAPETH